MSQVQNYDMQILYNNWTEIRSRTGPDNNPVKKKVGWKSKPNHVGIDIFLWSIIELQFFSVGLDLYK